MNGEMRERQASVCGITKRQPCTYAPSGLFDNKRFVKGRVKRMRFAYEGFTQYGDIRCFLFRGIEDPNPTNMFCIEVELRLLLQNRVPVQDGPMFCHQLLTTASLGGSSYLNRFLSYRVVGEDLRPLVIQREQRAAEKGAEEATSTAAAPKTVIHIKSSLRNAVQEPLKTCRSQNALRGCL
jgi:hypothetical protein